MTLILVTLALGIWIGAWLVLYLAGLWVDTEAGRRHQALARAENRIRDAQTAALTQMAIAAEAAVHEATGAPVPMGWPSEMVDGASARSSRMLLLPEGYQVNADPRGDS